MNLYLVDGDVGPSSFGVRLSRSALEIDVFVVERRQNPRI